MSRHHPSELLRLGPYGPDRCRPLLHLLGHRDRLTDAELRDVKLQAAAFCAVVDWELARRACTP